MHLQFSDEEKKWIELKKFGWPVKEGCPKDVEKSIQRKKKLLNEQMEAVHG